MRIGTDGPNRACDALVIGCGVMRVLYSAVYEAHNMSDISAPDSRMGWWVGTGLGNLQFGGQIGVCVLC